MNEQQITENALRDAWVRVEQGLEVVAVAAESLATVPDDIRKATAAILSTDSAPNRQYLLTIAAGTAIAPETNPASLQLVAGVDRRSQAKGIRRALSEFRAELGLTFKISQDAGVSNQWREPEIKPAWVLGRKKKDQEWASAFLTIVTWLASETGQVRQELAESLLNQICEDFLRHVVKNALNYPKFLASPAVAMGLVRQFISSAPDRPDATEAVVAAATRVLASKVSDSVTVSRSDVNSPDPIDVLVTSEDGRISSGIEVTDTEITLGKLEHEVVPAMLQLGLDRATVVSLGVAPDEASEIESYISKALTHFGQRIDLVTVDIIEAWLNYPATERDMATDFLWAVGTELDEYSRNGNRQAWHSTLTEYASSI